MARYARVTKTHICRYCGIQLDTMQGLRSHQKQSRKCRIARTKSLFEMHQEEIRKQTNKHSNSHYHPLNTTEELTASKDDVIGANDNNQYDMLALDEEPYDLPLSPNNDRTDPNANHTQTRTLAEPFVVQKKPVVVVKYPGECARRYGVCESRWEVMFNKEGKQWGGFADQDEWELARWLVKSRASQKDIDDFSKLPIVSMRIKMCIFTYAFLNLVICITLNKKYI